jgi:hypothetical protein
MAKDYKITVDTSMLSSHGPDGLEKDMQHLGREGWELKHVTSATESRSGLAQTSRIYLFWEREVGARVEQNGKENFDALVRKQLGGATSRS